MTVFSQIVELSKRSLSYFRVWWIQMMESYEECINEPRILFDLLQDSFPTSGTSQISMYNLNFLICFYSLFSMRFVKFTFSEKATKIDEIFTVDLTVTTYCQIDSEEIAKYYYLLHPLFSQNRIHKARVVFFPSFFFCFSFAF